MKPSLALREQLLQTIVAWGTASADVRALALVGSGARVDRPADAWSDLDVLLLTPHPERYLNAADWLRSIGTPWISTVERSPAGQIVEQRVLFETGIDVDWIVLCSERTQALREEPVSSILRGGLRVLVDKDGVFNSFAVKSRDKSPFCPPAPEEFAEVVNDFWFHSVWTAKKIKRGELWTAKSCCDHYMKRLLLTMIEWHAHTLNEQETWYNGRFIEQWAAPEVLERLPGVFAHYDEADLWKALLNTMDLFDQVGRETAQSFRLPYPDEEAQSITRWLAVLAADV
jgi:aminoglycoside 6-adenylyltransferase